MFRLAKRLPKKHAAPLLSVGATLLLLVTFMSLWSTAALPTEEFGLEVVQAFGTVLVALSALYAGAILRSRQEEAAEAKAQLALNVELRSQVVSHESADVIEVEARVKNVSSLSWSLPALYVFLHRLDTPQTQGAGDARPAEIVPPDLAELTGRNIARFPNSMTRLCPDEEDIFSCSFMISRSLAQQWPYYLVIAEAIGAPDSEDFDAEKRSQFIALMDGLLDVEWGNIAYPPIEESAAEKEARQIRHSYMFFESAEPRLAEKCGKKILILPPGRREGQMQEGRIDSRSTEFFRPMLSKCMMWSRAQVVCVGAPVRMNCG